MRKHPLLATHLCPPSEAAHPGRRLASLLTGALLALTVACGSPEAMPETPTASPQAVPDVKPRTLEQGLVGIQGTYSHWTLPNMPSGGFYNIDGYIFPSNDPLPSSGQVYPAYFFSNQFTFVGGQGGYIGLQKDANGKRAIFSIWETNGVQCSGVAGAICRPFSGEGVGHQTMIPFNWQAGRSYRMRVWVAGTDAGGEWWVGAVQDTTTGVETQIGLIRVPFGRGWLGNWVSTWVEWYGAQVSDCGQLPGATTYFGAPWANAGTVVSPKPQNRLGSGACPSSVTMENGWARHRNGSPPEPRNGIEGTYSSWVLPNMPSGGFFNIDEYIFPGNDPTPAAGQAPVSYFYSTQFGFVGGPGGYIGVQKDGTSKVAIFSIWDSNGVRCGNVAGAICRTFGGEGVGHQTLIPYNWQAGRTYRLRVWAGGTDASGEWWVGAIKDTTSGIETQIGQVRVPFGRGWLNNQVITWVEWWKSGVNRCSELPASTIYFGIPRGNADAVYAGAPTNTFGTGSCPSKSSFANGWARHDNGGGI